MENKLFPLINQEKIMKILDLIKAEFDKNRVGTAESITIAYNLFLLACGSIEMPFNEFKKLTDYMLSVYPSFLIDLKKHDKHQS